jgi:hypothetical protein
MDIVGTEAGLTGDERSINIVATLIVIVAKPSHASPRHATPRHATPRHAKQ